jgi:hypothetical protein
MFCHASKAPMQLEMEWTNGVADEEDETLDG